MTRNNKISENFKSAYGHGHKIIYDAVYNKIKRKQNWLLNLKILLKLSNY